MKKSRLLRTAVLAMALCGWGLAARADLVYEVTGTFGTTTYTGPLNGGTFSGTFDATLAGEQLRKHNRLFRCSHQCIGPDSCRLDRGGGSRISGAGVGV